MTRKTKSKKRRPGSRGRRRAASPGAVLETFVERLFPRRADPAVDVASRCVLVVDDDAFSRAVLVELLGTMGIAHVRAAADAGEALAVLLGDTQPHVDIVICDLDMPRIDGIELLQQIAERRLARGVIIASGREPDILRGAGAMVGAHGFALLGVLQKPIVPAQLRKALARKLPERPARAPAAHAIKRLHLTRALARREFYPVFQPLVSLATRQVLGVEALARWQRPDGRTVAPNDFLPALTREGLLAPLADLMLEESCRALKLWQGQGLALGAAINVSMSTLADLSVANRFERIVRSHGVAPSQITLEVTETEVMADEARVLNVLSRLRLKGFQLAVDDFGTGYSSLQQLNTLPFTELKIDQNFVRNCGESSRLRDIVESSIELAHRLGIPAVAEGVETEAEWSFLLSRRCDEAQGFFIARPMPADEIPAWSARWVAASTPA